MIDPCCVYPNYAYFCQLLDCRRIQDDRLFQIPDLSFDQPWCEEWI
ncbi:hypothetical protein HanXRQr2_Chr13g0611891 [Helianthus annuus]|uniref:Uncharacterized protein n=1 Tax=Helianthus annuus TaxID=4232 RepID=A0A9K3HDW6_HELAN|nr:hypothetical protein HanXRQr2_Chr13g0611891 [Helianthus annuus]KAJ0851174.1 hypothetical protein HanPSC8_Chr13g0589211 [Helianthus annuus]